MSAVEGKQYLLEQQLCEALGFNPKEVRSVTFHFAAGGVAQATVILYPDKERLDEAMSIVKQYQLVANEKE